jgi:hypothetical protein
LSVRALTASGDWSFGQGQSDYISGGNPEVVQNISTRLGMWLGDCFFALIAGIDWGNLLGSKNVVALNMAIASTILGTDNVTGLLQFSAALDPVTRDYSVSYRVQTTFSQTSGTYTFNLNGTSTT